MRFFAALSIFATLAFSAFTSASPVALPDSSVAASSSTPASAPAILSNLRDNLTPLCGQLSGLNKNNANPATVGPIIGQMTNHFNTAIAGAKALHGQPSNVVYGEDGDGEQYPLENVAKLLADVICLVIATLCGLLRIVGRDHDLWPILGPVGHLLTELLIFLIPVVAGLVKALVPLLRELLDTVSDLVTALGLGGLIIALGL